MSYLYQTQTKLLFSSSNLLSNNETFTSNVLNLGGYSQVQTDIVSSSNGTIFIEFCADSNANDVLRTLTIPYVGNSGYQMFSAPAFTPYVRYNFTCTEEGQSDFWYSTKVLDQALSPQILGVEAFISSSMVATLSRSVLVGKTTGNYWNPVSVSTTGELDVNINNPSTAFGEMKVAESLPVVQLDFVNGENNTLVSNTTNNGGYITSTNSMIEVHTSANTGAFSQLYSNRYLRYRPGQGALGRFTALFTTPIEGSNQYSGLATDDLSDGFMFGYNGTTFGIWHIANSVKVHIPQSDWNTDNMSGTKNSFNKGGATLNPLKGNVYEIAYQYLGFGNIKFSIEDPETGKFEVVHQIKYANEFEVPSIFVPSLNMVWRAENTTNANNITVMGASCALFVEGIRKFLGPRASYSNNKTGVTTATNIFTLKNCTTFNTKKNRSLAHMRNITFGGNASGGGAAGIATLTIEKNSILTTPTFVAINGTTSDSGNTINGSSTISVDSVGSLSSSGAVIYSEIVAVGSSSTLDVTDLDLFIAPGETLTFAVSSTGTATVGVGVVWNEDL